MSYVSFFCLYTVVCWGARYLFLHFWSTTLATCRGKTKSIISLLHEILHFFGACFGNMSISCQVGEDVLGSSILQGDELMPVIPLCQFLYIAP